VAANTDSPTSLLSLGEVARRVGCSNQTVRDMEKDGRVPPARRLVGQPRRYYSEAEAEVIRRVWEAGPRTGPRRRPRRSRTTP
jgi:hypothetical protein